MPAKFVLIVDDSIDIRECFQVALESAGYRVETAIDGVHALKSMKLARPDVIILDAVMPVMDGFEFLYHARSDFAGSLPPVILCSGFDITVSEAKRRGTYAFLRKPVALPQLIMLVEEALAGRTPSPAVLNQETELAAIARMRASQASSLAVSSVPMDLLTARIESVLVWLKEYFDVDLALFALMREKSLVAISITDAPTALKQTLGADSPILSIIETGSTLVVPDASNGHLIAGDWRVFGGIRSFAGVPIFSNPLVAIGALCLAMRSLARFPAEDVLLLEEAGRRSARLWGPVEAPAGESPPWAGLPWALTREGFEVLVEMELRVASRRQNAIELAIFELEHDFDERAADAIRLAGTRYRTALSMFDKRRIALFKRALDVKSASRQINEAAARLSHSTGVRGIGSVLLTPDSIDVVTAESLIQMAVRAVNESIDSGGINHVLVSASSPAHL